MLDIVVLKRNVVDIPEDDTIGSSAFDADVTRKVYNGSVSWDNSGLHCEHRGADIMENCRNVEDPKYADNTKIIE